MGKFLRQIFVNDKNSTDKVNEFQLQFFVDTVLSNPINKRYRSEFEGKNILEVFSIMTANLKNDDTVKISNGTKEVELSVNDWKQIINANLKVFNDDTVKIEVKGKTLKKEAIEIQTL